MLAPRKRSGFTVVELIVVIVIMTVLLLLAVVRVSAQQLVARDNERKQNAENIARGLEMYYDNNGFYPHMGNTVASFTDNDLLSNVEFQSYRYSFNDNAVAFVLSTTTGTTTISATTGEAQATTSNIVYLPMIWSGSVWQPCDNSTEVCTRYRLLYRLEGDTAIQKIESRNQR